MFVITNYVNGKREFYAIDQQSGGYPYWSSSITNAKAFGTKEDAKTALYASDFNDKVKMTDGSVHPPRMIHSALGLCNTKLKGYGKITIDRLEFAPVFEMKIMGEIKA